MTVHARPEIFRSESTGRSCPSNPHHDQSREVSFGGGGTSVWDRHLVAAVCRGDRVASAHLYPYLRPSIEDGLGRIIRRASPDFDDLLQLTFERIILRLRAGGFQGRSSLKTWAYAIAVHVALDATRRRSLESRYLQRFSVDLGHMTALPVSAEARLEARSSLRQVQDVLSRMSPVSARATALRHVLECRVEEVAYRLGLSTTATASRIRRARAELERRMNVRAANL